MFIQLLSYLILVIGYFCLYNYNGVRAFMKVRHSIKYKKFSPRTKIQ